MKEDMWIVFGDGTAFLLSGEPFVTVNFDGIKEITFDLKPTENGIKKFELRFPDDYQDIKKETIRRTFPLVDAKYLREGYVEKERIEYAKLINEVAFAMKPMMGEGKFKRFKELTDQFARKSKYLLGVVELPKDPLSSVKYFCFSDLNGNQTEASSLIRDLLDTVKNQQKTIFSLQAKVAMTQQQILTANSNILEHNKSIKEQADVLKEIRGRSYPESDEELAAKDESYTGK